MTEVEDQVLEVADVLLVGLQHRNVPACEENPSFVYHAQQSAVSLLDSFHVVSCSAHDA